MIAQGIIDIYVVEGDALGRDLSKLIFCVDYTELPDIYTIHQVLILAFDFAPLKAWTAYKAVANQKNVFNASEWIEDHASPYALAIEAAQKDGALSRALADGKIVITYSPNPKPTAPDIYDIWETTADLVNIEDLSASDAEAFALSGSDKVYYYFGLDNAWHLCTEAMRSTIEESQSTYKIKSEATMMNTVTLPSGQKLVNGWISLISYENGETINEFGIVADNFYVAGVGQNVALKKPFSVNTLTGEISFNGLVSFTNVTGTESLLAAGDAAEDINANATTIDGGKLTTGSVTTTQLAADSVTAVNIAAQAVETAHLSTGIQLVNGEIVSSDFTVIGGAGFRLKSNAAGTSDDPTIYGAYIKGSTISADSFMYETDAGLVTETSISDVSIGVNYSTYCDYDFEIYPYNSSMGVYKLSKLIHKNKIILTSSRIFTDTVANGIEMVQVNAVISWNVKIYVGNTVIGDSGTLAPPSSGYSYGFTVAGINFVNTVINGRSYISLQGNAFKITNFSGEGAFKIKISCLSGQIFAVNNLAYIHINI